MGEKRSYLRVCVILGVFGVMSLLAMIDRPSVASIRGVDIVHLIGTGMCFGGSLIAFAVYLQGRRSAR